MGIHKGIALIFFSRSAETEALCKPLSSNLTPKQRLKITKLLRKRSLRLAKESHFDVIEIDEHKQKGQSFGERISNAFQDVFNLGYEAIITIGNDCIDLHQVNWNDLGQQLTEGKCIVGPNFRDGAYLIGITKASFDFETFKNLSWQSPLLKDQLLFHFDNPHVLEILRDVNDIKDINILLTRNTYNAAFRAKLLRILSFEISDLIFKFIKGFNRKFYSTKGLRAPPALR